MTYSVAAIRETYPKAYDFWDPLDEAALITLDQRFFRLRDIARILKRQPSAITARLRKLGRR
jgi:Mn-dependent DtxR family transcriptional regulator